MSISYGGRASRLASSCPKDFDFEFFVYQNEANYNIWWSWKRVVECFKALPDDTLWNCVVCVMVLFGIINVALDIKNFYLTTIDQIYNAIYAAHVFGMCFEYFRKVFEENMETSFWTKWAFGVDFITYVHYPTTLLHKNVHRTVKFICYYFRLHRPFSYLLALTNSNLKGSVVGTTLKYLYIFIVVKITFALLWIEIDDIEIRYHIDPHTRRGMYLVTGLLSNLDPASQFGKAIYIVNKMFVPIGPVVPPANDYERLACMFIMIVGCFVVAGAAIASLALVISLYMKPEEAFRARFRLIMKEMADTNMPLELREKVETFYRMYWHKQKAVSVTQLLPVFPPTLPAMIYTDIYFEAHQKSPILRDLSYQFLWEVAKTMETIHYIPGDAIIKRSSKKSSIIYITYGDVEMLTAEDDDTPILRLTRGTDISPCGGCVSMACGHALVEIRAATFCTAHVLKASDLWRVASKYGKHNGQGFIILSSFEEQFERIKRHYRGRAPQKVKYKSSILYFKRNLMALKEAKDEDGRQLLERTDYFLEVAGSYIMRNRTDSSLTDEADDICLRPTFPCILQPSSSLLVAWNALVSVIIVVVTITHPYNLVFLRRPSLEFRFFDYITTGVFILDLVVYLSTGANVEEGVAITFAQTASQQMRSYWFVLDVIATAPIFEFVTDGHFAGINKLLRLPKVFRMLKSMENVCVYHSNAIRFMSYTLIVLIACYLTAALQQAFMCFIFNSCAVRNFTNQPFWMPNSTSGETTATNRLTFSLYWAVSMITFTSHKTSDPKLDNTADMIFTYAILEYCIVLNTFIEAVYSATIMVTTALTEDYVSCIEGVKQFLIRNNVDPLLRQRFTTYLELGWYIDKAYSMTHDKKSVFYDLPPHVYHDIMARQRSKYIMCIPFMKYLNKEDLKGVSSHARLFYTSPNEILLNTGDINNEIYVIVQGICEVFDPDAQEVMRVITVHDYFGSLECLLRFPAYYTVRAVTHLKVLSIARKHMLKAIDIPKMRDAIEFAKLQQEFTNARVRREPFLTYEPLPPTPNREVFKLPKKYETDAVFMHPFNKLGFLAVLRYIFPRFTIRPDGNYIMRYEWFRGVCALVASILYPSYMYMVLQIPSLRYVHIFLDMAAYFDILQRMLTGYYNEAGVLVYHPSSTAAHYIKGAFLTDLMASMPLELLESEREITRGKAYLLMSMAQYLMLNRLLQLYRLPSALSVLEKYVRRDIIIVINAFPLILMVMNVMTCMMVFHSVDIYGPSEDAPWRIVPREDVGGSWLELFHDSFRFNMTESPWNLHLATFSWVVYETTTTGYGVFNPSNLALMRILFCGMVFGTMLTLYYAVRVLSTRSSVNQALAQYQAHMKDMVLYMRKEKLDSDLQKDVLAYYEYNWDKMGGTDYRQVLKLCDQITLRTDTILHIYGYTFAKCPILYHCDLSLLRVVGRAVHNVYFQKYTRIIQKDDVLSDLYFVDYGTVEIQEGEDSMDRLPRGSVFGNLDPVATVRTPMTVIASSSVHLLQINSLMFHKIIIDFPTVMVLMKKYRPHKENYIFGSLEESSTGMKHWKDRRSNSTPLILAGKKSFIQYLETQAYQVYLIIICMACVYIDVFNAGFEHNSVGVLSVLYLLDVGFYFKILFSILKPHLESEGEMKSVLMDGRKSYLKTEFRYDVLSVIPIELLCLVSAKYKWRLFSLLRLNRLFRVTTVYKCLQKHHERLSTNLTLTTVSSVFIWFTLFIHITSCVWYQIGVIEDMYQPNSSWQYNKEGQKLCRNHYICTVYFVVTTFTQNGVGDILPRQQCEIIFVTMLEVVSTMMCMVYVGEFSNVIQYQSFRSFEYYIKYLELQEFLKNNRVSKNLMTIVNKYSLHLWRESRGLQVPHFLKIAPACFKLEIMAAAYMEHLKVHPVFKDCEEPFLRQLVGHLQLFTYSEGIAVVKEGEITDSMYMIHKGMVNELDEDMDEKTASFGALDNFGMMQGLVRDTPFQYSYKTSRNSAVLTLSLDDWEYLLQHFPRSRYEIYKNVPGHPHGKPPPGPPPSEPMQRSSPPVVLSAPGPGPGGAGPPTGPPPAEPELWPTQSRAKSQDDVLTSVVSEPRNIEPAPPLNLDLPKKLGPSKLEHDLARVISRSDLNIPDKVITKAEDDGAKPNFLRRMTETAKKLVGRPSIFDASYVPPDEEDEDVKLLGDGKDNLLLQEDMKATTALIEKYEKKITTDADDSNAISDLLNKYKIGDKSKTEEKDQAKAEPDKKEGDDEEDEEDEFDGIVLPSKAPRLSFVPGLVLKEQQKTEKDKDEPPSLLKAPRRSIVSQPQAKDKSAEPKSARASSQKAALPLRIDDDETASTSPGNRFTRLSISEQDEPILATTSKVARSGDVYIPTSMDLEKPVAKEESPGPVTKDLPVPIQQPPTPAKRDLPASDAPPVPAPRTLLPLSIAEERNTVNMFTSDTPNKGSETKLIISNIGEGSDSVENLPTLDKHKDVPKLRTDDTDDKLPLPSRTSIFIFAEDSTMDVDISDKISAPKKLNQATSIDSKTITDTTNLSKTSQLPIKIEDMEVKPAFPMSSRLSDSETLPPPTNVHKENEPPQPSKRTILPLTIGDDGPGPSSKLTDITVNAPRIPLHSHEASSVLPGLVPHPVPEIASIYPTGRSRSSDDIVPPVQPTPTPPPPEQPKPTEEKKASLKNSDTSFENYEAALSKLPRHSVLPGLLQFDDDDGKRSKSVQKPEETTNLNRTMSENIPVAPPVSSVPRRSVVLPGISLSQPYDADEETAIPAVSTIFPRNQDDDDENDFNKPVIPSNLPRHSILPGLLQYDEPERPAVPSRRPSSDDKSMISTAPRRSILPLFIPPDQDDRDRAESKPSPRIPRRRSSDDDAPPAYIPPTIIESSEPSTSKEPPTDGQPYMQRRRSMLPTFIPPIEEDVITASPADETEKAEEKSQDPPISSPIEVPKIFNPEPAPHSSSSPAESVDSFFLEKTDSQKSIEEYLQEKHAIDPSTLTQKSATKSQNVPNVDDKGRRRTIRVRYAADDEDEDYPIFEDTQGFVITDPQEYQDLYIGNRGNMVDSDSGGPAHQRPPPPPTSPTPTTPTPTTPTTQPTMPTTPPTPAPRSFAPRTDPPEDQTTLPPPPPPTS